MALLLATPIVSHHHNGERHELQRRMSAYIMFSSSPISIVLNFHHTISSHYLLLSFEHALFFTKTIIFDAGRPEYHTVEQPSTPKPPCLKPHIPTSPA